MTAALLNRVICGIITGHNYSVEKWHFTHGENGNEPAYIEGFFVCLYCGKRKYFTVERGSKFEQYIMENMKEREG